MGRICLHAACLHVWKEHRTMSFSNIEEEERNRREEEGNVRREENEKCPAYPL